MTIHRQTGREQWREAEYRRAERRDGDPIGAARGFAVALVIGAAIWIAGALVWWLA